MNARDQVKPKSIRLAILMALADGQITTIDDLLLRVEEPRKKVVENAGAASNDLLIKRMRDDVTGLAAYQILPAGKKYLAKYADGNKTEPVAKPVVRENQTTEPETKKPEAAAGKLTVDASQATTAISAAVIAAKDLEIASLSRRLRDAIAEIETLNAEQIKVTDRSKNLIEQNDALTEQLADVKASLELSRMARAVVHQGYVIQRPAKPLVRITKAERAKERALAFARGGKRAQVFALVAVGTAVPGSEWKE